MDHHVSHIFKNGKQQISVVHSIQFISVVTFGNPEYWFSRQNVAPIQIRQNLVDTSGEFVATYAIIKPFTTQGNVKKIMLLYFRREDWDIRKIVEDGRTGYGKIVCKISTTNIKQKNTKRRL